MRFVPEHQHDCTKCVYIGTDEYSNQHSRYGICDVYYSCEGSDYDFIIRYGANGDYITVLPNDSVGLRFCLMILGGRQFQDEKIEEIVYDRVDNH